LTADWLLSFGEVLTAYRGTGDGWQTRINAELRRAALKLRKA
jgi:uncharacterized protein (DUF4415 family)